MEGGEATSLLFQKTSQRLYYFGQNEKTILLFGVGRGYDFKVYVSKAEEEAPDVPFLVRVSIPDLNIRKGPGTNFSRTGSYTGKGVFTIVDISFGQGSTSGWGKLKSGAVWISLDYTSRI